MARQIHLDLRISLALPRLHMTTSACILSTSCCEMQLQCSVLWGGAHRSMGASPHDIIAMISAPMQHLSSGPVVSSWVLQSAPGAIFKVLLPERPVRGFRPVSMHAMSHGHGAPWPAQFLSRIPVYICVLRICKLKVSMCTSTYEAQTPAYGFAG